MRLVVFSITRHVKGGNMKKLFVRLWEEQEGQDLTEYALLLVLIALAAISSIKGLSTAINGVFNNAASNLTTNAGGS
jgi:pilus assembly protein Flp/PilA